MRNSTGPWLVAIAAIAILSTYIVWPFWPNNQHPGLFGRPLEVRPGLDIQGGLRVLLAAESGESVDADKMNEVRRVIDRRVNALGVAEPVVQLAGNNRIIVELPGIRDPKAAIDTIQTTALLEFVDFKKVGACTSPMPTAGQYIITDVQTQIRGSRPGASPTAAATARATLAATTTATPTATTTQAVQTATPLATATDQATATATALNRVLAQDTPTATDQATAQPTAQSTAQPTAAATAAATAPATPQATPSAAASLPGSKTNPLVNPCTGQPFTTVMTGAGLRSAEARVSGTGSVQYVVAFTMADNDDARRFDGHVKANRGEPLAVVLDGEVLSAPTIGDLTNVLSTGGQIEGSFTRDTASTLALQLRSGALPVSLRIESLEQVGASLGAESVQASVRAGVLGILIVLTFLLVFYRIGGLAAALALVLFGLINFALYKYLPVTLTLSAITGFLISIGTAVDGNILIFERIKEEVRTGRPLDKAIALGFQRAWPSIRESNISTILIGFILYFFGGQFGASAVRGFAVTLILGLVINLFTAVIVTRTFLTLIIDLGGERLRRMNLFG